MEIKVCNSIQIPNIKKKKVKTHYNKPTFEEQALAHNKPKSKSIFFQCLAQLS